MHPKDLSIEDYSYNLPEERIAAYPLEQRDSSRLLIYQQNKISEDSFRNIPQYLPESSMLVFNNTRVIKARIHFQKQTGAVIEIFCLEPFEPNHDYAVLFQQQEKMKWKCLIGGAGKWKQKVLEKKFKINEDDIMLRATLTERLPESYVVDLAWEPAQYSMAEIMEHAGETPLPPYIKRKAEESDTDRYQTIYSLYEGSVAAPTAGLHFTPEVFESLRKKSISTSYLTLHVSAGTFIPVKAALMQHHEMHAEWMEITKNFIQEIIHFYPGKIFCVGTTSLRAFESLYWMGIKILNDPSVKITELPVSQWEVYESPLVDTNVAAMDALQQLLEYLEKNEIEKLLISTQIIIAPGYQFKMIKGLVTNFHQPKSTLLLLVAALAGNKWKEIYEYALDENFRFLSYGDGCLISI
jgi:S-adenosylmethionine:tRNA ribosyltransferase-isomerase